MGAEAAAGYAGIIGGAAAHTQGFIGNAMPSAAAQRKEFQKARNRLRTGTYGYSNAQQQQAQAMGNQQLQAQAAQQQSDVARLQAAGALAGGAATEAQRAIAQQQAAGAAQVAQGVQAASNAQAQAQYAADQGRVDAQADRARAFWKNQADISMQTTQGAHIGEGSQAMGDQWSKLYGANPQNGATTGATVNATGVK